VFYANAWLDVKLGTTTLLLTAGSRAQHRTSESCQYKQGRLSDYSNIAFTAASMRASACYPKQLQPAESIGTPAFSCVMWQSMGLNAEICCALCSACSDVRGAGTDADISAILVGEQGSSKEMRLESSADNFERGKVRTNPAASGIVGRCVNYDVAATCPPRPRKHLNCCCLPWHASERCYQP
jgi:hypothetical protein